MKLKNSNCDETQQLKLQQNSKMQRGTKPKNSNGGKTKISNCEKSQKLKLREKSETQIVTKLKV